MLKSRRYFEYLIIIIVFFSMIFIQNGLYATNTKKDKLNNLRGVWVASVVNIDFPKERTIDSQYLKQETIKILDNVSDLGFNAVFLQVRPTADALYKSDIFPYSKYLTGTQGLAPSDNFDPLKFWIEEAHKRNIQIHAWINPYRITKKEKGEPEQSLNLLHENHPARLNPQWVVKHGSDLYFNPGIEEVRNLILSGITELMANYNIDGIHMDDYFYPSANFADEHTYSQYNGSMSLEEWRVDNVNKLVSEIHSISKLNKNIVFGISPFGIWKNKKSDSLGSNTSGAQTYYQHFADSRKWMLDNMVDYIVPQIYWEFGHSAADYKTLVDWWVDIAKKSNAKLLIGHAAYKQGSQNINSAWYGESELLKQVKYAQNISQISGSVFFSYRSFSENENLSRAISSMYNENSIATNGHKTEVKAPENQGNKNTITTSNTVSTNEKPQNVHSRLNSANEIMGKNKYLKIDSHKGYSYTDKPYTLVKGIGSSKYNFYINGELIFLGSNGIFDRYLALKKGENYFIFQNGDEKVEIIINYRMDSDLLIKESSIIQNSFYPQSQIIAKEEMNLSFIANAPVGARVLARFNGRLHELKESKLYRNRAVDKHISKYTGSVKLPKITDGSKTKDLGRVEYIVNIDGVIKSSYSSGYVSVYKGDSDFYCKVAIDNADNYFKANSSQGSAHMLAKGMIEKIEEMGVNYTKLSSGYWIRTRNISSFYVPTKIENKVEFLGLIKNEKEEILSFKTSHDIGSYAEMKNLIMKLNFPITSNLPDISSIASDIIRSVHIDKSSKGSEYILKIRDYDDIIGYYVEKTSTGIDLHIRKKIKSNNRLKPLENITIMLDAGHGGKDPGTQGYNSVYPEKIYVLEASFKLKKHLENMGATVYMTRYIDEDVYLADRHRASLAIKPDLFLSIHADAIGGSRVNKVKGFSIYLQHDLAAGLARDIKASMLKIGRNDRGIHPEDFYVTRGSWCISLLLEMGYLTNPEEYQYLKNPDEQEKQTYEIAKAIADYFQK